MSTVDKPSLSKTFKSMLYFPKNKSGKQYVIPDIHGCLKTFKQLLKKIEFSKDDQLFLLGDYINRGPNSTGLIDYILKLRDENYEIHCIRGNHEQLVLDVNKNNPVRLNWLMSYYKSRKLLNKKKKLRKRYKKFFKSLPYYIELDKYFLVHAGFDFHSKNPFTEFDKMLWLRSFDTFGKTKKYIIHGHKPVKLSVIKKRIKNKSQIISLDNGCVYNGKKTGMGNLLCFEIKKRKLHFQFNVE